jgi:hypothetical protein
MILISSRQWPQGKQLMLDPGTQIEVCFIIRANLTKFKESELAGQLKRWLDAVPEHHTAVKGARIIIAPYIQN